MHAESVQKWTHEIQSEMLVSPHSYQKKLRLYIFENGKHPSNMRVPNPEIKNTVKKRKNTTEVSTSKNSLYLYFTLGTVFFS